MKLYTKLGLAAVGIGLMTKLCSYNPPETPIQSGFYKDLKQAIIVETDIDTTKPLEESLSNYAVKVNGGIISVTNDNLYRKQDSNAKIWVQTGQGYEATTNVLSKDGMLAIMYDDTLRQIQKKDVLVGFDGLGYIPVDTAEGTWNHARRTQW